MADFIVGSPVRDDDFCFREAFLEDLWEALDKHNVLLLAPRRTGKTSVMYRMLDEPRDGWLVIHLNVEDIKTPGEFVISLIDAIYEHQPVYLQKLAKGWRFLGSVLSRVERIEVYDFKIQLRKSENPENKWRRRCKELFDRIAGTDERVLFIIDELPDMLKNMSQADPGEFETFLHWFRKIRDRSLGKNLRWLVGGSVNLIAALDQQGLVKQVNDLKSEPLPSFTDEEVTTFVNQMLGDRKVSFDDSVVSRIQELLGAPIPLFLQMLIQELYRLWKRDKTKTLSAIDVDEVFQKSLLGEMARDKLQHYRSRLDVHYTPADSQAACYLLGKLSLSPNGMTNNALYHLFRTVEENRTNPRLGPEMSQAFQRLMLNLQSDFYVEAQPDDRFDFSSRLLKNWWKKYYSYECEETSQ